MAIARSSLRRVAHRSIAAPTQPRRCFTESRLWRGADAFQKQSTNLPHRPSVFQNYAPMLIASVSTALLALYIAYNETNPRNSRPSSGYILDPARLSQIQYATPTEMEMAITEIERELSEVDGVISTDSEDLHNHGYSEWSSVNLDTLPVAVAYPRNTEHVSTIARICHKWKVPVIAYSGGSSLEGHIAAPYGGISIDLVYLDQIVQVNGDDMDIVVQPGVLWTDINERLTRDGTAPSAKIGGMIGTNCSGTNAVRYGTMRDWVINLTIVLADGTILKTRRRPRKSSAGYNLNSIIVGSEGTLGIVTETTLKLAAVPQHYSVAVVPFQDIKSAVSAATAVVRKGIPVAAVELMDEEQMRVVNEGGATKPRVWNEQPTLFLKFSGTKATVEDNIKSVQQIIQPFAPGAFEFARDKQEQEALWSARKFSLYSLLALRKDGEEMWNTDVAVPLSRLAEIVEASKADAARLGMNACVKGHVGDGNFHENITYNKSIPEEVQKAELAVKNMVKRAIAMGGTCTGEHGIGFGKKESLRLEVGDAALLTMKLIKSTLNPHWIMNPGKVFDHSHSEE